MVDNLGCWTPEPDYSAYPKEKWCDMDRIANWIMEQGYKPKTSIENLVVMLILHYECETEELSSLYFPAYDFQDASMSINMDGLSAFVEASGGLKEFDYEC